MEGTAQLRSAVAGNRDALAQLLVDHSGALARRLQARLSLNPFVDFSAEDVLQEVFLDAHRGIESLCVDSQPSFAAWLNRVADNRLSAMLRERGRLKRGGDRRRVDLATHGMGSSVAMLVQHLAAAEQGTVSEACAREEVVGAIREALEALPLEQRDAMRQRYLAERSVDSTADALNKTDGAVRGLLHRAKRAMRDALGSSSRWFSRR